MDAGLYPGKQGLLAYGKKPGMSVKGFAENPKRSCFGYFA
jgi:hypothetical protein